MRRPPRTARRRIAVALVSALAVAALAGQQRPAPFLRGMVVSCPRAGQIWGTPQMSAALRDLATLGVGWVAIHPYARIDRDGSLRWRPAEETGYLDRAVEIAREEGMRLFWKPHLAYWGSFSWRGEIDFADDQRAWERFFTGYREFIVDQARFAEAAGAELFAVGVETEKTTGREADWRRIVAAVRAVYKGRITYAANWSSLDRVPFWDALDLIGVHAYFPLSSDENPDREALWRAWDEPLERLGELSARSGKPVLVAEIGYSRSAAAARTPWVAALEEGERVRELRARLIAVAAERLERTPFVTGLFWWKWIPGPAPHDRDFSMKDPEARAVLESLWGRPPAPAVVTGD